MKKNILFLLILAAFAASVFPQQYIPWGARNEKSLLVFSGVQTESYTRVNFVNIVGGGDSNIVELEYFQNNVFSTRKTTLNVLNSQSGRRSLGNPILIRIKTSHYQYVEVEAFTSEEKTPGVGRTRADRFFVIMPDSTYVFTPRVRSGAFEGTGGFFEPAGRTVGSDHIAYDVALMNREALDDFMDYIVSTVNYDDARAKVDTITRAFNAMTDKTRCAYNIGCTCRGNVAEHLIYEVSFKQGLLGAVLGGFPPWAAPAEFLAARIQLQAQAILACTLGMYHGRINLRSIFNRDFKNHCYVLFGNASPPNVAALGAVGENTIIEMGQNILQTIAPRGLSAAVPFIGTAIGIITGGAINAGEARAFGLKADAFYRQSVSSGLDGVWNGIHTFTISGSTGVYTRISNAATERDAIAKGYLTVGGPALRNITKTGDLTYTCQVLVYISTVRNVASGSEWRDMFIVLSADGKTCRFYWGSSARGQSYLYTRQ